MSSYLMYEIIFELVLFVIMYMMSFHLVMNSDDWFLVWLGLEINMMMFIMIFYKRYSMSNVESCLKYFFIQSLGSAIFLVLFYFNKDYLNEIMCMVLSYKVGAGIFFYWFPSVCSGISWVSCFILMIIQKVLPLMLMMVFISWIVFIIVFVSLGFGVLGSFNQSDIKQMFAYSSIYHLGWVILCLVYDNMSWVNYLFIYGMIIFPIFFLFGWMNVIDLLGMIKFKCVMMVLMLLSMAGMPPFLGFFLKWYAFLIILKLSFIFMLLLVISSIIMFYVYFRMSYDILMGYVNNESWNSNFKLEIKSMNLDLVSCLGMVVGLSMGVYFMF